MRLAISDADCTLCGVCLDVCSEGAVNLAEGCIEHDLCIECEECVEHCPSEAIFDMDKCWG